jgi:hypothetical protein
MILISASILLLMLPLFILGTMSHFKAKMNLKDNNFHHENIKLPTNQDKKTDLSPNESYNSRYLYL